MTTNKLTGHFLSGLTIVLALVFFFPIFWMFLTSFKTEAAAFTFPPPLTFTPTLENYQIAIGQSKYFEELWNTVVITGFLDSRRAGARRPGSLQSRLLPRQAQQLHADVDDVHPDAAAGRDHRPAVRHLPQSRLVRHAQRHDALVHGLQPAARDLDDALVPLRPPLRDPRSGAHRWRDAVQEFRWVILPLALPGLMATVLLCFIFTWNEFFLAFNLTITKAAPLSVFIASFKTSEGLFWAKMSAAATITALPVVLAGWLAQHQLVRGLTAGAVK